MQHFPSVIPVSSLCHSRDNGNPVFLSGSRIKCGMTKRNVDPQSEALRFRLRMTPGLSVEDDGRLSVKDDTRAFGWG